MGPNEQASAAVLRAPTQGSPLSHPPPSLQHTRGLQDTHARVALFATRVEQTARGGECKVTQRSAKGEEAPRARKRQGLLGRSSSSSSTSPSPVIAIAHKPTPLFCIRTYISHLSFF